MSVTTPEQRALIWALSEEIWATGGIRYVECSVAEYGGRPQFAVSVQFTEDPSAEQAVALLADLGADADRIDRQGHGSSSWAVGTVVREGVQITVTAHYARESEVERLRAEVSRRDEEIARLRRQAGDQ